jgi:hypothetical protein
MTDTVIPTMIGVGVAVLAVVASGVFVRWWNRDR